MIQKIRTSKVSKFIAIYLAMMILLEIVAPMRAYALTEGPTQPEFNSFTPIGTSDMVNLSSGDFNYNIPIMDVGGYPINLAYDSEVTMDQEASWVGLGWNLNVGQISRQVRGLPDDFKGDEMLNENNMKKNVTIGVNPYVNFQLIGTFDNPNANIGSIGAGLNIQYNNYTGMTATPSMGLSFNINKYVSLGMNLTSSSTDGVSVTPSASLHTKNEETGQLINKFSGSFSPSMTYNSRQGLQSFSLAAHAGLTSAAERNNKKEMRSEVYQRNVINGGGTGTISFNNTSFTPSKRIAFKNTNGTLSFSVGPDVWASHVEFSMSASVGVQDIKDKVSRDKAYGYEYTDLATQNSLLDFNREKELSTVSKTTKALPLTNYTYDIYTIQAQNAGGNFRPYRSQVGYVFDPKVEDESSSMSLGVELEGGAGVHWGANFTNSPSVSYTKPWNTEVSQFFKEKITNNPFDYEKVYYKMTGETRVDDGYNTILVNKLGGTQPITLKLSNASKSAVNTYYKKATNGSESTLVNASTGAFNGPIMRQNREKRNQLVQKVTKKEAENPGLGDFITLNNNAKDHHTAGYIITDGSNSRTVYGITAYNKTKKEVSFSVGGTPDCTNGLISYSSHVVGGEQRGDNSKNNSKGIDNYFNAITTPEYAHTYLISSILSPDYEDLTGNGPTDDDLGAYTKFSYTTYSNYKWRVPFNQNKASYNEALKTKSDDDKGSYVYGEKELKYVKTIETKTHVAFFDLEERKDGFGVLDENGGLGSSSKSYKIKSIRLYSKPDVLVNGYVVDPGINSAIKPIKTAHFIYDYSLCQGVDNNNNSQTLTANEIAVGSVNNPKGKLTLKKVYFTYKGSNMGKYTPFVFDYSPSDTNPNITNPGYNIKNYDVWGNYKPNTTTGCSDPVNTSPQEFPYVDQTNKAQQDIYAASWSLSSIQLPSGGLIKLDYESDDYKYVQNRKALQMFKVEGVSYNGNTLNTSELYNSSGDARWVVIKADNQTTAANYKQRYIGNLINQPIFFNFLVNMTNSKREYVQGYFDIDPNLPINFDAATKRIFIPMKQLNREGKNNNSNLVNPISLAGWYFGRQYLNREVYGQPGPSDNAILGIAQSLVSNLAGMVQLFIGPNGHLRDVKSCAKTFTATKSWVRLQEPSGKKLGGGARVKKIMLYDAWDEMLGIDNSSPLIDRYKKKYGQLYSYDLADGTSSGVATFEPNVSKENPFVKPFYHNSAEQLAPRAVSYTEEPFGESFFPSPTVTYSRVTVSNQPSSDEVTETGKVITYHYTSYDFPTRTDFTTLAPPAGSGATTKIFDSNEQSAVGMLGGMLGLPITIKSTLVLSQGFVVETNDMNGRVRKTEVYNQTNNLISSIEYKYNVDSGNNALLSNTVRVINKAGASSDQTIGVHYDVINDLRETYANSKTLGVSANVDCIPLVFPFVVGMGVPQSADHTQVLRTSVTTKVIHKTGILKETIAFDLGSKVSTKNLAWDADSGQVLLTETINEYDDKYYTLNYPAYWHYDKMGHASANADVRGIMMPGTGGSGYMVVSGLAANQVQNYLKPGDQLVVYAPQQPLLNKLWVSVSNANGIKLMKQNGDIITTPLICTFRLIRSGYANLQAASMANIVSMSNPLGPNNTGNLTASSFVYSGLDDPQAWKVLNASAIEYTDDWASQCENGLPMPVSPLENPYLYNLKGEWRPSKSYAYLTGRNSNKLSTRFNGFYKSFAPFYQISGGSWVKNNYNWTYASVVSKYSPYGVEIENRDALNRYSSAQFGFNYKLPVALASNTRYKEIGFDGFEDYANINQPSLLRPHFGFSEYLSANAYISGQASHTGKKSIAVKQNSKVTMIRTIDACDIKDDPVDQQPPRDRTEIITVPPKP